MGRLTKINEDACQLCKADYCIEKEPCFLYEVYEKLGKYEDLEEQGRLIEVEYATIVGEFGICSKCGESYMDVADADADQSRYIPNFCPWCGARFVSEAEAKLKELEGDKE